jgi:hypothetical protein
MIGNASPKGKTCLDLESDPLIHPLIVLKRSSVFVTLESLRRPWSNYSEVIGSKEA